MIFKCNKSDEEKRQSERDRYANTLKLVRKKFYRTQFAWLPTKLNDGTGRCVWLKRWRYDKTATEKYKAALDWARIDPGNELSLCVLSGNKREIVE